VFSFRKGRLGLFKFAKLAETVLLICLHIWPFRDIYNYECFSVTKFISATINRPTDMNLMMAESNPLRYNKGVFKPELNAVLALIDITELSCGSRCLGCSVSYSFPSLY
jgi:hypothetical protein